MPSSCLSGACFSRPGKVGVLTHSGVNFGEFASVLAVSSPGGSWVLCCGVGRMCKHGRQANRSCDAARTQLARDDAHLRYRGFISERALDRLLKEIKMVAAESEFG